jgi:hypothetical protein
MYRMHMELRHPGRSKSSFHDVVAQSQMPQSQGTGDCDAACQSLGITVTANRVYPVENPGWDLVGLDFVLGIMSSGAQFTGHIQPRHASNAPYPQNPLNGRFAPSILSLSTTPDQFDSELGLLFNQYTPAYWGPTAAGLALEFVLPGPVGTDFSNTPTNSWTVVLAPAGSGVYQVWTTYPGHPVPND